MINGKHVLAIIPARGGSKGLPGKNIRELCGKPLIAWTIEKAKKSKHLDMVLVSTDSPVIANIAKDYGADAPFLRPAVLASDHASTYDVIQHALTYFRETERQVFDYTVLLEPTSPLREDDDIDRMLEALDYRADEYDAIVSVGEVSEHPSIMKRLIGERMEPFCSELTQTTRRQDNAPAYFPYGVAYIAKTASLLEENTFYTRRCMSFPIKRYQNHEIDDLYDFLCVESVMKHEWRLA
ncbi:MAG: acylneuraminate cytidylyltransferase [Chloroflexi bacterium RBG_16_52_11]|nr:MAG: acylneuraminate cytidylyltransferase [Chloroflexi bacterium RBG_16_52_11]